MNLLRQHLSDSQRAMVGATLATLRRGNVAVQKDDGQICPSSIKDAADLVGVGTSTIKHAKIVRDLGTPEEIKAVEAGEVAVSMAAVT